jgi:hypothetical protein
MTKSWGGIILYILLIFIISLGLTKVKDLFSNHNRTCPNLATIEGKGTGRYFDQEGLECMGGGR